MKEFIELVQKDLILHVDYNSLSLDIDAWDDFLDCLCGDRYYQKEAIKNSIKYLAGKNYDNLSELAKENYKKYSHIQEAFPNEKEYLAKFSGFGNKLFANIDLATGTGKSYVMYGIAQIMLSLGLVKKVLILCPSLTIEDELTDKFIKLAGDKELLKTIPQGFALSPTIVDAKSTILDYSICVENIHSVYSATGSSIKDSFTGKGTEVLVLNDESHHIFNSSSETEQSLKKWASFLLDKDYSFYYMLGFTGTAYQGDNYFLDVIYKYSLRQAINDGFVKSIEYIQEESEHLTREEKFQIIFQLHEKHKIIYRNILKPLTILITRDTDFAESLRKQLIEFLVNNSLANNPNLDEISTRANIEKTVLKITHKSPDKDKITLKDVDSAENKVEWIIGVSMLNEGWDVKNVFQIVPMEDKAFNSKLLISQVLGRGLRKPDNTTNPKVVVLNHDAWGKNIKHLVDEVLELETKIHIGLSHARKEHNFLVHNVEYSKEEVEIDDNTPNNKPFNYSKMLTDGISLESQAVIRTVDFKFEDIKSPNTTKSFLVVSKTWTIEEILDKLYSEFAYRNWEGVVLKMGENLYSKENLPPRETLKRVIQNSLNARGITGNEIIDKNAQRIFSAFSTLLRKTSKKADFKTIYNEPMEVFTENMNQESYGVSNFRKSDFCLFYTENYDLDALDDTQKLIIEEFINGGHPYARKQIKSELFKTNSNYVITASPPEKKFVEELTKREIAVIIDSWVKSKNRGFYSIDYSSRSGSSDSRNREYKTKGFNPDFFIKITHNGTKYILVNEIKGDKDLSSDNKAKYKYAKRHFETLNEKLRLAGKNEIYIFHMLSPQGYTSYFEELKKAVKGEGKLFESQSIFRCELENLLEAS